MYSNSTTEKSDWQKQLTKTLNHAHQGLEATLKLMGDPDTHILSEGDIASLTGLR